MHRGLPSARAQPIGWALSITGRWRATEYAVLGLTLPDTGSRSRDSREPAAAGTEGGVLSVGNAGRDDYAHNDATPHSRPG